MDSHPTLRLPVSFAEVSARPFLKWTGGKQWLATAGRSLFPPTFEGRYFEPFLGGGAVFFATAPERATLSDVNPTLVATYQAVRDSVEDIICELHRYPYSRTFYEGIKREDPQDRVKVAARLIYLNKTSFNGIYRVNRNGEFNVPFGRYTNPTICHEARLRRAAVALRGTTIALRDFARTAAAARRGDLIYFDPPYITGHTNNGFVKYNALLFSWADQERLAATARRAQARGVHVAVSNALHDSILRLYPGFNVYLCSRRSAVGVGESRQMVPEALLTTYELSSRIVGARP